MRQIGVELFRVVGGEQLLLSCRRWLGGDEAFGNERRGAFDKFRIGGANDLNLLAIGQHNVHGVVGFVAELLLRILGEREFQLLEQIVLAKGLGGFDLFGFLRWPAVGFLLAQFTVELLAMRLEELLEIIVAQFGTCGTTLTVAVAGTVLLRRAFGDTRCGWWCGRCSGCGGCCRRVGFLVDFDSALEGVRFDR